MPCGGSQPQHEPGILLADPALRLDHRRGIGHKYRNQPDPHESGGRIARPGRVGLIGLLTNLAGTASTIAGLGLSTVATRQIAEAAGRGDEYAAAAAHRALFWATLYLALAGAFIFWLLREPLAAWVLGDAGVGGR